MGLVYFDSTRCTFVAYRAAIAFSQCKDITAKLRSTTRIFSTLHIIAVLCSNRYVFVRRVFADGGKSTIFSACVKKLSKAKLSWTSKIFVGMAKADGSEVLFSYVRIVFSCTCSGVVIADVIAST